MNKKIFLLVLFLFFIFIDVHAEENKVYWKFGGMLEHSFHENGISYFLSENGLSTDSQKHIIFNNTARTNVIIDHFDSSFDVSKDKDNSVILGIKDDTIYIQYNGILSFNSDSRGIFISMKSIESILGLNYVDTSNVENMDSMFFGMTKLKSIDLSNFNTSNVTSMSSMFNECSSLESLNLSSFNTSKVTDMAYMFSGCSNLTSIHLNSFDTSKVTDISKMFDNVNQLSELDISNFDLSSVQQNRCLNFVPSNYPVLSNLITIKTPRKVSTSCSTYLYASFFDEEDNIHTFLPANQILIKAYTIRYMGIHSYGNNPKQKYIKHGSKYYGELMVPTSELSVNKPDYTFEGWYAEPELITEVTENTLFDNKDIDLYPKFLGKTQLSISFSDLINGYIPDENEDCSLLFTKAGGYCHSPYEDEITHIEKIVHSDFFDNDKESLIISTLDSRYPVYVWLDGNTLYYYTGAEKIYLTNKTYHFSDLSYITELDLSKFDTSGLTTMSSMFSKTTSLDTLDLSNFDTSNVVNMRHVFSNSAVRELDLANFDTSNVTTMSNMFYNCKSIEKLQISSFDTSNVSDMSYMFANCFNLKELDLSHFNTSKLTNMRDAFRSLNVKILDLSSFDLSLLQTGGDLFVFAKTKLSRLVAPKKLNDKTAIDLDYYYVIDHGTNPLNSIDSRLPSKAVLNAVEEIKYYNKSNMYYVDAPKTNVVYSYPYGELYNPPAITGYIFAGWYAEKEHVHEVTSDTIVDNEIYTNLLYSKWIPKKYTVTWKNYDGTILEIDEDVSYGSIPSYDGAVPVRDGYVFQNWYSDGNNISPVTGDIVYTANFIQKVPQSIAYTTHVENIGWQDYVMDGKMAGTSHRSLRLEGIKIKLNNQKYAGDILYRTHIENVGWENDFKKNNEMSGTSGRSLRLEAIEIKLTGEMADYYDVYYRVHAQEFGWLGWARNGEKAGTARYAYRLEGIEIILIEKGIIFDEYGKKYTFVDKKSGKTTPISDDRLVAYATHVESIGWQDYVTDGEMSGTSHKSLRLEGIKIKLNNRKYAGDILYRTHIENVGWENDFKKNNEMSGTSGKSLRLEAIEIKLTGEVAKHFDIYYRVHAQNVGWMNWAKNGEKSGTAHYSYRLEAIEIVLVDKGEFPPARTDIKTNQAFLEKA